MDFFQMADHYFSRMMKANATEPYIHSEYERYRRLAKAALLIAFDGDTDKADAFTEAFDDSNEPMSWYLTQYGVDRILVMFGPYKYREAFYAEEIN